jgi:muconolactone delta-isomerase
MLFMVISTPRPDHPSQLVASRSAYWDWINPLIQSGQVKSVYARVGRGAVALFDVDSTQTLHRYMNEWSDIIPAHMEVFPLLDVDHAKSFLASQHNSHQGQ